MTVRGRQRAGRRISSHLVYTQGFGFARGHINRNNLRRSRGVLQNMMKMQGSIIARYLLLAAFACAGADSVPAQENRPLLFESNELLELTMPVDFDALCRPSEDPDCGYTATEFRFRGDDGNEKVVPISIRRREGWRAQQTNCQVPTLFVRFTRNATAGTPFEGQQELALTSHCGKGYRPENVPSRRLPDQFESYVINEYLGYRLFNLVTEASLRARLVRIRYVHPDNPRLDFTNDAFFTEHFESLARRLGAELLPPGSFDLSSLDYRAADQVAVFHYMIGNTDWSIIKQDNVVLLRGEKGKQVPVVYDLDMSGLVDAHYAQPAPGVPIHSVKQRYFKGFCHPYSDWDALFQKFQDLREPIMTELANTPGLGRGDRRVAGAYLDGFFRMLEDPEARDNNIVKACLPLPQSS